jgi:hypothetical protein
VKTCFPLLVAVAALAVGSVGCVKEPVLALHSARISGVSPQGVLLTVTMKVNNDNDFDVRVRNVRANVTIQQRYTLPYLQYNPDRWLGSDAETYVPAPVTIPWTMIQPLLATSIGSPWVSYHLHGLADVTATRLLQIQATDYGIDANGTFSRGDLVMAAGRGVLGGMTGDHSLIAGTDPQPLLDSIGGGRRISFGILSPKSASSLAGSPWDTAAE